MTVRELLAGPLAQEGPWTTVVADVSRDLADPKRTVDLRHRSLIDDLEAQGAPKADRDAVHAALVADHDTPSPCARYVAVRAGEVVIDEILQTELHDDGSAWFGPVLDPLPLLVRAQAEFDAILVEAQRGGGTITRIRLGWAPDAEAEHIEGRTDTLHKVPVGGWSQARYQRHAEETWRQNEAQLAERIDALVTELHPRILVVGGDIRAVELLSKALSAAAQQLLWTVPLETAPPDVPDALSARFEEAVAAVIAEDERVALERIHSRTGGEGRQEALGIGEVVAALQSGQVGTLLVRGRQADERTVIALDAQPWVSTAPEGDFAAGELGIVPASVGLARAAVLTDADVIVTAPGELPGDEPAAALLRWPVGPAVPAV